MWLHLKRKFLSLVFHSSLVPHLFYTTAYFMYPWTLTSVFSGVRWKTKTDKQFRSSLPLSLAGVILAFLVHFTYLLPYILYLLIMLFSCLTAFSSSLPCSLGGYIWPFIILQLSFPNHGALTSPALLSSYAKPITWKCVFSYF